MHVCMCLCEAIDIDIDRYTNNTEQRINKARWQTDVQNQKLLPPV